MFMMMMIAFEGVFALPVIITFNCVEESSV
jgi:hypothetical protein